MQGTIISNIKLRSDQYIKTENYVFDIYAPTFIVIYGNFTYQKTIATCILNVCQIHSTGVPDHFGHFIIFKFLSFPETYSKIVGLFLIILIYIVFKSDPKKED